MTNLHWEQSNLKPPIWWQLRLAGGMLDISVRHLSDGYYYASVGRGYTTREAAFPTLDEAKSWGVKEARKILKEMNRELMPRYYLLEVCLGIAIALHIIWLVGGAIGYL